MAEKQLNIDISAELVNHIEKEKGLYVGLQSVRVGDKTYTLDEVAGALVFAVGLIKSTESALMELVGATNQLFPEFNTMGWEDIVMALNDKAKSESDA